MTKIEKANEVKAIIDTEISKPFPRIPEVKHALRALGVLLVELAGSVERLERISAAQSAAIIGGREKHRLDLAATLNEEDSAHLEIQAP